MTLQTIADRVGVSRMTVSNAFSRPDQLSAELRRRILDAADALGYAGPDPAARALARGTTGAVGILLTDSLGTAFTDEVASSFLGAIAAELAPSGLAITLLSDSGPSSIVPARDIPMDGALVYSCTVESQALTWLERRHLPLVYVDQEPATDFDTVNIDDRNGARLAAEHLVQLGHRRIGIAISNLGATVGIVDDPLSTVVGHVSRQRLRGWLDALTATGIQPVVAQGTHKGEEDGRTAAQLLLTAGADARPTAILCFSDVVAFGVVQEALRLGLAVPDDLSVVGFDDNPLAQRMTPPLTTVRQDVAGKGRAAAAALTAAIARARSGAAPSPRHVELPTELIVRASTAPPRD